MASNFTICILDCKASEWGLFPCLAELAQCCCNPSALLHQKLPSVSDLVFGIWKSLSCFVYWRALQTLIAWLLSFHWFCFTVKGLGMRKPSSWSYVMTVLCPLEGHCVLDFRWGCSKPRGSPASERCELSGNTSNAYVVIMLGWVKVAKVAGVWNHWIPIWIAGEAYRL